MFQISVKKKKGKSRYMTQIFLPERSMKCNNLRFGKYSNSEDGIFFTGFGS